VTARLVSVLGYPVMGWCSVGGVDALAVRLFEPAVVSLTPLLGFASLALVRLVLIIPDRVK
jgi:hypothetical protein